MADGGWSFQKVDGDPFAAPAPKSSGAWNFQKVDRDPFQSGNASVLSTPPDPSDDDGTSGRLYRPKIPPGYAPIPEDNLANVLPPVVASAPRDAGWGETIVRAAKKPFQDIGKTAIALGGGKPTPDIPETTAEQPLAWKDIADPNLLGKKFVNMVLSTSPELAGGILGGIAAAPAAVESAVVGAAAGTAGGPVGIAAGAAIPPALITAVGVGVGSALAHALRSYGPTFAGEFQKTPSDPDGAFDRAWKETGMDSIGTGLGFAAFGIAPFKSVFKNLLFQAGVAQPLVAEGQNAAENVFNGRPAMQGASDILPGAVIGTALPLIAHRGVQVFPRVASAIDQRLHPRQPMEDWARDYMENPGPRPDPAEDLDSWRQFQRGYLLPSPDGQQPSPGSPPGAAPEFVTVNGVRMQVPPRRPGTPEQAALDEEQQGNTEPPPSASSPSQVAVMAELQSRGATLPPDAVGKLAADMDNFGLSAGHVVDQAIGAKAPVASPVPQAAPTPPAASAAMTELSNIAAGKPPSPDAPVSAVAPVIAPISESEASVRAELQRRGVQFEPQDIQVMTSLVQEGWTPERAVDQAIAFQKQNAATQAVAPVVPHQPTVADPIASVTPEQPVATTPVVDVPQPLPEPSVPSPETTPAGTYVMVDPEQLTLDPERFQYKASGDGGVTGALHGVDAWEQNLASPITVWQSVDGKLYVVNGHQRTDLALRAKATGQQGVQMPAKVFREADGYTPAYMRALGAYQNMSEGSGTAVDAANMLRGALAIPEGLRLPELPPRGQMVAQGRALARLSDGAFGAVVNGVVPPAYAAHVGDLISDPTEQMAAIDMLARAQPANSEEARLMVQDIRNSGFLKGAQTTLFGEEEFARSLIPERARVLDKAMRSFRQVRGVFRAAVQGEESLTAAGNSMDTAANTQAKTENERLLDALQRNATTRGPISDALSAAAADVASGKPIAGVVSRFLSDARRIVRSGQGEGVQSGVASDSAEPTGESGAKPPVDLLGNPIAQPRGPRTAEPTIANDPNQITMPGMGPSAIQAQAASDAKGPKGGQEAANQGLFAPPETEQPALFGEPKAPVAKSPDVTAPPLRPSDMRAAIAEFDAKGVAGELYRRLPSMATVTKNPLKPGETWRDRALQVAHSHDGLGAFMDPAEIIPVEHVTKKDKKLIGYVRKDMTEAQAKAVDRVTFRKDGGWFIRKDAMDKARAALGQAPVAQPVKDMGPHYTSGQIAKTEGTPRTLPSYFTDKTGPNAKAWLKGWDDTPSPVTPPAPQGDGQVRVLIGKNRNGHPVYATPDGVRSYVENGIRITESVSLRPTRDGMELGVPVPENKAPDFQVAEWAPGAIGAGRSPEYVAPAPTPKPVTPQVAPPWETNMTPPGAAPKPEVKPEAASEQPKPEGPQEGPRTEGYGANNKTFTADAAERARARLREKMGRLNSLGLDYESMADGFTLAGFHVEAGARKFADYARAMIGDLGGGIRPYLSHFYGSVRDFPGFDNKGMDTHVTVETQQKRLMDIPEAELAANHEAAIDRALGIEAEKDPATPDARFADAVADILEHPEANKFTARALQKLAEDIYGTSLAEGTLGRDHLYDSIELGVNRYIQRHPEKFSPAVDAAQAERVATELSMLKDSLPTQTVRAGEKDTHQQFSTPPDYAYAANWVANLKPADRVMEPSAGTGGMLVHAMNAGVAETHANELSAKRRGMLEVLQPNSLHGEDATQIHNILPDNIRPTVVVMNPPFSAAAGRMGDRMVLGEGARHVEQALARLEPGGRLVAIVGDGMRPVGAPPAAGGRHGGNGKAFEDWWKKIGAQYDVRANLGVDGGIYRKYGTTFPTRLLVIDKIAPSGREMVTGQVQTARDLIDALKGIRDERPEIAGSALEPVASEPSGAPMAPSGEGTGATPDLISGPTGAMGSGRGDADVGPGGSKSPAVGGPSDAGGLPAGGRASGGNQVVAPESERLPSGNGGRAPKTTGPGAITIRSGGGRPSNGVRQDGSGELATPGVTPTPELTVKTEVAVSNPHDTELTESVYEAYKPERVKIEGSQPHPTPLVQSAAMASVLPPKVDYSPRLPKKLITSGALSDAQLEAIVYAGRAHDQMLPAEGGEVARRRGLLIGDGTGVGKGREIAGIILNNWNQGRKKAVWVSENMPLIKDAQRDWGGLGGNPQDILSHQKTKSGAAIKGDTGILFTAYSTLGADFEPKRPGVGQAPKTASDAKKSRVDQIVDWLGKDFDGVIAFDESHNMANGMVTEGTRGKTKAAAKALAGMGLQQRLPNARVVYVSATGATEVNNLAYADRLGLWGRGTPFPNRGDFLSKIQQGGIAGMELIARDMKALGHYIARNLSYDGVEYNRLEHPLTDHQKVVYDKMVEGWQTVLGNINQALADTESPKNVKTAAMSQFWGTHQRFFNQIITSMQMPSVLESATRDIAEGRQVVLQLVNTMEAAQTRAVDKAIAEGTGFEDLDMTPRDQLLQMVERAFPIHQYEDALDDQGEPIKRPVLDAMGNHVVNKEALAARDRLLDELASLSVPDGPLEMLLNHFGTDKVAEVTGRSQRVVRKPNDRGQMETVVESRGADANISEANDFQSHKKPILVFSQAGGTGRSYHDERAPGDIRGIGDNSRRRSHYLVQAGWIASKAVQGFGRTHRTNQYTAPIFHLVTTDLDGQKRFISSIARRLAQLGALTKGERRTGDQGLFGMKDNLESDEAHVALESFIRDIVAGDVPNLSKDQFEQSTGLKIVNKLGGVEVPKMNQFLNRLLSFKFDDQNRVFQEFGQRLDTVIDRAAAAGTLDTGTETFKADRIEKKSNTIVYTDPQSGAETRHVELEAQSANHPASFDTVEAGQHMTAGRTPLTYVRNKRSGRIYALTDAGSFTNKLGQVIQQYRLTNPLDYQFIERSKVSNENWERIPDKTHARDLWEAQVAATPPFRTSKLHIVTGAVLPIWDRLAGNPKIFRLQTSDGERMLGRVIPNDTVNETLKRLGAEDQKVTASPKEIVDQVMGGAVAHLANGWTIKRSLVAGDQRLELTGPDFVHNDELKADGVFTERLDYKLRYFIPTGEKAAGIIEKITRGRPVTQVIGASGSDVQFSRREAPVEHSATDALPSQQAVQAMADAVHAMMGGKGRVEIVDAGSGGLTIHMADGTTFQADGYAVGRLIRVALDGGKTLEHLNHEVIHVLRNMGVFTPQEWSALTKAAERGNWIEKFGIRDRYPGLSEEKLTEEAIADAHADAAANPKTSPTSLLGRMAAKIGAFFARLRNFMAGRGFQTADDVFGKVQSGEVGSREPGSGMLERGPADLAQSAREADTFHDARFARRPTPGAPGAPPIARPDILREKKGFAKSVAETKALFAPTALRGAKPTEQLARAHGAGQAQSFAQAVTRLEKVRDAVDRLSKDEQIEFTDRMEYGNPQATPEVQAVSAGLRDVLDKTMRDVQSLGRGYLANAIDNYMGHIWGNYAEWAAGQPNPTPAEMTNSARAAAQAKNPLQGSKNFLKRRTFPTQKEAIDAGLIPVTYNPVDLQLLKIREMQKFYHGTLLADKMKETGIAQWVRAEDERAAENAGMVQLDDKVFQPRLTGSANPAGQGRLELGNWYAPEPAARIFNNYMSRGLAGHSVIYDTVRGAGNALNTLQLGLSGFHATFVMLDTMISRSALGLHQIAGGQIGKGLASIGLGMTPISLVQTVRTGAKLRNAFLDPDNATPEMREVVDDAIRGGVRINMDQFYRNSAAGTFFKHMSDLKHPESILYQAAQMFRDEPSLWRKAVMVPLRFVGRLLDTLMEPLMGHLVPRAKLGVFSDMARQWVETHPNATEAERSAAMIKAWDSVENRLGQMTYDNVYWKKVMKDLAFITTRSVGWNLGTVREIGGAFVDTAKMASDIGHGQKPEFTYRQAYTIMLPIVTGILGAMLTYLATGRGPQSDEHDLAGAVPLDYFYPRTGKVGENGIQERMSMPGYMKDVIAFKHDPWGTIGNKLHPLMATVSDFIKNRDYYGGIIYNKETDNRAGAYIDHLLNQSIPFTFRSVMKMRADGATPAEQALSFWGFQPAPKSIVEPERGEMFERRADQRGYRKRERESGRFHIFTPNPSASP